MPLESTVLVLDEGVIGTHSICPGQVRNRNPYLSCLSPQSEPTVFVPGKSSIGAHSFCLGQVRNRSPQFLSRYSKLLLRSNNFEFADVASSSLLLCAVAVSFWGLELWTLTSATSSKNAVWSEGNVSGLYIYYTL